MEVGRPGRGQFGVAADARRGVTSGVPNHSPRHDGQGRFSLTSTRRHAEWGAEEDRFASKATGSHVDLPHARSTNQSEAGAAGAGSQRTALEMSARPLKQVAVSAPHEDHFCVAGDQMVRVHDTQRSLLSVLPILASGYRICEPSVYS